MRKIREITDSHRFQWRTHAHSADVLDSRSGCARGQLRKQVAADARLTVAHAATRYAFDRADLRAPSRCGGANLASGDFFTATHDRIVGDDVEHAGLNCKSAIDDIAESAAHAAIAICARHGTAVYAPSELARGVQSGEPAFGKCSVGTANARNFTGNEYAFHSRAHVGTVPGYPTAAQRVVAMLATQQTRELHLRYETVAHTQRIARLHMFRTGNGMSCRITVHDDGAFNAIFAFCSDDDTTKLNRQFCFGKRAPILQRLRNAVPMPPQA